MASGDRLSASIRSTDQNQFSVVRYGRVNGKNSRSTHVVQVGVAVKTRSALIVSGSSKTSQYFAIGKQVKNWSDHIK